jgi:hypothetical protein
MTGWLCNAKCVDQSSGKATCDTKCAESSGQIVFIDDTGKLFNISDQAQEKVRPMAGKHCMIKAEKDPPSGELDIQNMPELRGLSSEHMAPTEIRILRAETGARTLVARWNGIESFRSAWSRCYSVLPTSVNMGLILPNAFSIDGRIR